MIPDLIIYNFQTNRIKQEIALGYIQTLLDELKYKNIDTHFLNIIDGNELYPTTFNLINKILKYWSNTYYKLPIFCIYRSFLLLYRHLNNKDIKSYGCFIKDGILLPKKEQKRICEDLLRLVEGEIHPYFFNSIIITGDIYSLEAPYGIALGNIFEGGVCLNSNIDKRSIWHETAHLLGAQDHYDEKNNYRSINCGDPNDCLMQWNSLNGNCFCDKSLDEIREHITLGTKGSPI